MIEVARQTVEPRPRPQRHRMRITWAGVVIDLFAMPVVAKS
jgi:hypothetical protein